MSLYLHTASISSIYTHRALLGIAMFVKGAYKLYTLVYIDYIFIFKLTTESLLMKQCLQKKPGNEADFHAFNYGGVTN